MSNQQRTSPNLLTSHFCIAHANLIATTGNKRSFFTFATARIAEHKTLDKIEQARHQIAMSSEREETHFGSLALFANLYTNQATNCVSRAKMSADEKREEKCAHLRLRAVASSPRRVIARLPNCSSLTSCILSGCERRLFVLHLPTIVDGARRTIVVALFVCSLGVERVRTRELEH